MQPATDIGWWQLAAFSLVLLIPAGVNRFFRLGIGRETSIAVLRMSLQLLLVGLYLQFLFSYNSPALNLAWLVVMLLVGASAITGKAHLPKRPLFIPVLLGLLLGLTPVLMLLLLALLKPSPVYSAQYLIPLAGMLLGNSLSGSIVALQRLFNAFQERKPEYHGALVLGAVPAQAAKPFVRSAMQQSLAPILATMSTTGLVTLPGMMTGQILGGSDPMVAIKYQLVIMVAIFVMMNISVAATLVLSVRMAIAPTGRIRFSLGQ
jgi:putative ABC transport system permease protein